MNPRIASGTLTAISMYIGIASTKMPTSEIHQHGLRPIRSDSAPAKGISSIITTWPTTATVSALAESIDSVVCR